MFWRTLPLALVYQRRLRARTGLPRCTPEGLNQKRIPFHGILTLVCPTTGTAPFWGPGGLGISRVVGFILSGRSTNDQQRPPLSVTTVILLYTT